MRFGTEGTIENASPITKAQYDEVMRELQVGKGLLLQAAELIKEQRDLIEKLKQEIERGKFKTPQVPS